MDRGRRLFHLTATFALAAVPAMARDPVQPAELPPASYRGQQYVDSLGCAFLRVGGGGAETRWIPRVNRDGARLCGYPPSGTRVPVAEGAAAPPPVAGTANPAAGQPPARAPYSAPAAGVGRFAVAVGSFGVPANAENAEARVRGAGYPVLRRQLGGAGLTAILAGPFASRDEANAARSALVAAGFAEAVVLGP